MPPYVVKIVREISSVNIESFALQHEVLNVADPKKRVTTIMYLKPFPAGSLDEDKVSTVFYTIVGPMVNPFIYSLRNKDVQVALRKTLKKRVF